MKKTLADLKAAFEPYAPFWEEWTNRKGGILTEAEIYSLGIHATNNFTVPAGDLLMFYNKTPFLQNLTRKLILTYPNYQLWVLIRFGSAIVYVGLNYNPGQSFSASIQSLKVSKKLKDSLLQLNAHALKDLLKPSAEKAFKKKDMFKKICHVIKCVSAENKSKKRRRAVVMK